MDPPLPGDTADSDNDAKLDFLTWLSTFSKSRMYECESSFSARVYSNGFSSAERSKDLSEADNDNRPSSGSHGISWNAL